MSGGLVGWWVWVGGAGSGRVGPLIPTSACAALVCNPAHAPPALLQPHAALADEIKESPVFSK